MAGLWLWLHQYKQDTIIKAFEQTGISLCPSGKDDRELHVRGILDLVVGSWQIELESNEELEYFAELEGCHRACNQSSNQKSYCNRVYN